MFFNQINVSQTKKRFHKSNSNFFSNSARYRIFFDIKSSIFYIIAHDMIYNVIICDDIVYNDIVDFSKSTKINVFCT